MSKNQLKMGEYNRFQNVFGLNIDISLNTGDITRYKADCVVSPSDSILSGSGGVSYALHCAAGSGIKKEISNHLSKQRSVDFLEVLTTDSYNLSSNYKNILHIVSPGIGYPKEYLSVLAKTFDSIFFQSFIRLKHQSIALPFIGTGTNGIHLEHCIESFFNGIFNFLKENDDKLDFKHKYTITFISNNNKDLARINSSFQTALNYIKLPSKPNKQRAAAASNYDNSNETKNNNKSESEDDDDDSDDDNCVICMDTITNKKKLDKCNHSFCKDCIDDYFSKAKPVCPSCGQIYGIEKGIQPEGTMKHKLIPLPTPGYEKYQTIQIDYAIPDGIQGPNHPHPGRQYYGAFRTAYLPDCPEGREVLELLKKAFENKLIFTVGQSRTTGEDNVVTWNDIHHKTNMHGGTARFGYPDPTYLKRVKQELAAKGITNEKDNEAVTDKGLNGKKVKSKKNTNKKSKIKSDDKKSDLLNESAKNGHINENKNKKIDKKHDSNDNKANEKTTISKIDSKTHENDQIDKTETNDNTNTDVGDKNENTNIEPNKPDANKNGLDLDDKSKADDINEKKNEMCENKDKAESTIIDDENKVKNDSKNEKENESDNDDDPYKALEEGRRPEVNSIDDKYDDTVVNANDQPKINDDIENITKKSDEIINKEKEESIQEVEEKSNKEEEKLNKEREDFKRAKEKFYKKREELSEEREKFNKEREEFNKEKEKLNKEKEEYKKAQEKFYKKREELSREREEFNKEREEFNKEKEKLNKDREEYKKAQEKFYKKRGDFSKEREKFNREREEFNKNRKELTTEIVTTKQSENKIPEAAKDDSCIKDVEPQKDNKTNTNNNTNDMNDKPESVNMSKNRENNDNSGNNLNRSETQESQL